MDSSDVGKVVFIGSIAQLGVGILPPVDETSVSAPIEERFGIAIPIPKVTATIRYPVQETDLGDQGPGMSWNLVVRYRDGGGSVTVQLIQVSVVTGVETPLIGLESGVGYPRSNNFHDEISQFPFATDFQQNVYYVAVTLTGPAMILGIPPAIQLMQIKG